MSDSTQDADSDLIAWGDMHYDSKTPAEVVHDYAVTRGDLCEQYARDQLSGWIERYARAQVEATLRERRSPIEAIFHTFNAWTGMCGCGAGPFVTAEHQRHYLAATASVGETVCDLDAPLSRPGESA